MLEFLLVALGCITILSGIRLFFKFRSIRSECCNEETS